jgi:hypothetical protein
MNESPQQIIHHAARVEVEFTGKWLAKQLGISYPTYKKRMQDGKFTLYQAEKIKQIYKFITV